MSVCRGHKYRCKNYKKTWGFGSKAGERLYNKQQAERLQKLSYNSLLHSADDIWSQKLEVEIQIRTLAMNFWSTIEHSLQYKYKEHMPEELRKRLLSAADAVGVLDNEMASVRDEIMDAQNHNRQKANIIADIVRSIEELYYVANKREVEKIQDEFYKIYKQNDMTMLKRFNKQLDIIAETYRAQSLNARSYSVIQNH